MPAPAAPAMPAHPALCLCHSPCAVQCSHSPEPPAALTRPAACPLPCSQPSTPTAPTTANTGAEIALDKKWNFIFCCLEAAAGRGMPITYAQAAAHATAAQ